MATIDTSTNTSPPVSAATFEAAGADPATAAQLFAQHEAMAGRGDASALLSTGAPPPQTAADAQSARTRLDQITSDRSAGKISDWEWRTKYEPEALKLRDQIVAGSNSDLAQLDAT